MDAKLQAEQRAKEAKEKKERELGLGGERPTEHPAFRSGSLASSPRPTPSPRPSPLSTSANKRR